MDLFRFSRIAWLAAIFLAAGTLDSPAQNTLTESDKERILKRLDKLLDTALESKFGRYTAAMTAFQAAAETPAKSYDFYLDCYKLVNFDRKDKKASEFRDWKAARVKELRSIEHSTMLQFQLRYLIMTIRAAHMEDRNEIIPQLNSYITAAVGKADSMGKYARELRGSVTSSIFAQAYEIDKTLGKDERWETAPLNIAGHYQKLIFPLLREEGNTKGLEQAWDRLINLEVALMEPVEDEVRKQAFVEKKLPELRWAKWSDIANNGERARGANEMLKIIESNMGHDSVEGWIKQLADIVQGGSVSDADFDYEEESAPAPEKPAEPAP